MDLQLPVAIGDYGHTLAGERKQTRRFQPTMPELAARTLVRLDRENSICSDQECPQSQRDSIYGDIGGATAFFSRGRRKSTVKRHTVDQKQVRRPNRGWNTTRESQVT